MTPGQPDPLEKAMHSLLRNLPDFRAPQTLESAVLRAIASRSTLNWWKQPFNAWPLPARAGFLLLCLAAAAGCLLPLILVQPSLPIIGGEIAGATTRHLADVFDGISALRVAAAAVVSWVRPYWVYAIILILGANYALLAGLGAAWRSLQVNRSHF